MSGEFGIIPAPSLGELLTRNRWWQSEARTDASVFGVTGQQNAVACTQAITWQVPAPAAASVYGAIGNANAASPAAINSTVEFNDANISEGMSLGLPGVPVSAGITGGLFVSIHFAFPTFTFGQGFFCGLQTSTAILPVNTHAPSSLGSIIGVGCDAGDTHLFFMWNNFGGAGNAVKVDAGVTMASLAANSLLFRLNAVPPGAPVLMSVTNLENNQVFTANAAATDPNLVARGTLLYFHLTAFTALLATPVTAAFNKIVVALPNVYF